MRVRNISIFTTISVVASLITIFGFVTGTFTIAKKKPPITITEDTLKIKDKNPVPVKSAKSANPTNRNKETSSNQNISATKVAVLPVNKIEISKVTENKSPNISPQVFVDSDGNVFTKTDNSTVINPVGEYSFGEMSLTNNKGRTMLIRDSNKRTIKVLSIEYDEDSPIGDLTNSQTKNPIVIDVSNSSAQVVELNSPSYTNPNGYKVSNIENSQLAQEKNDLKPVTFTGNWLIDQGVIDGSFKQSNQSRQDQIRAMQEIRKQKRGGTYRSMLSPNSPYLPSRHN